MHFHHAIRLARTAAVLGLVAAALAPSASPARAGGFTLKLSAPPRVVVGQPTLIQVTGTTPVAKDPLADPAGMASRARAKVASRARFDDTVGETEARLAALSGGGGREN